MAIDDVTPLSGVIPAHIAPFDDEGRISVADLENHLAWLLDVSGVNGIVCNGHAAEVVAMDRDERRLIVSKTSEIARGRVPVIAGIYAENQIQALTLAEDAVDAGADALLIFPLNALGLGAPQSIMTTYYEAIARIGIPLVVFSFPDWSGLSLTDETLEDLFANEKVVGVKEWSLDIAKYERTLRLARAASHHIAVLSSFSSNLLPSLAVGADGILSGHGSVICDLHAQLFDLVSRNDTEASHALYDRIQILTKVVYRAPMSAVYARMKAQLVSLGRIHFGKSRPPIEEVSETERVMLEKSLVEAGLLSVVESVTSRL